MKIQDKLSKWWDGRVQINDKVSYDQRDIIEENIKMRNSQFDSPYFADEETEKYYYNVIHGFVQTLRTGSQLKLSEFGLSSLNGKFLKMVDILKGATKHYLKYNGWTEKKDEILDELISMGHAVVKVVDGETEMVDLRNLLFKPNAKSLKLEGCVEKIYYTYEEAKRDFGDGEYWKEIEEHWEKVKDNGTDLTFLEDWCVDEFDGEVTKGCVRYLDRSEVEPDESQTPDDWQPYLEVERFVSPHEIKTSNRRDKKAYGDKMRVFPYDEQRLITLPGRYLGMGVYEICRPAQQDYNEKRNLKRKFDRIALRGILVHKIGNMRTESDGEALTQEFLKRLDTGGALKIFSDESLERLNIGSTTNDTLAMTNDLFEFMRFMLGVTPIAVGQTGANKTASFAVIQSQQQQSTYQVIKNKTARLYERLFQDFLFEDIIEDILAGDTISIYADKEDLAEMDKFLAKAEVDTYLNQTKPLIDEDGYEDMIQGRVEEQEQYGENRYIDISNPTVKKAFKKLLKELCYIVEFNLTDEAIDKNVQIKTILEADQMQNEKLRDRVLDIVGISPKEFKESDREKRARLEEQAMQEQMMAQAKQVPPMPEQPEEPIMPQTLNV